VFVVLAAAVSDGRARWLGDGAARIEARPPHAARASQGPPSPLIFAAPYAFPPIAIGTEADARRALGALLRAARRPSDGWTARFVNRPLSLALTRLLVPTGVRPDHVTFVGLLIGIAAGLVAARGSSEAFVVGAALLQLQSVLDGCDGELARLTHRDSRLGALLDSLGDDLSNYVFFAGLAIGLHRVTGGVAPLVLGAIVIGCGGLATATEVRWLAHAGGRGAFSYPIVDRIEGHAAGASRLGTALQPILERDTFVLLTFLATALGLVRPLLVAAAIGSIAALIAVARSQRSAGVPPKRR
jgi:phosphatidylglycerophosphate synthase